MTTFRQIVLVACLVGLVGVPQQLSAGEGKKKRELPASGSLAGTLVSGYDSKAVDYPWGDDDISGKTLPPVSGSVSKKSPTLWIAKVFNNSEDRYSVDLEVVQYGSRGNRIKSDFFSYTLNPGQRAERPVRTNTSVSQCMLNLKGWKNLSEREREREAQEQEAQEAAAAKK